MSDQYQSGNMDISQNQSTWTNFVALVKWSSVAIGGCVLILTVWLG